MNTMKIMKTGITDLAADAVVNAANEGLWAGSGVCGAIFAAAGYDKLQAACDQIRYCCNDNESQLLYSVYYRSLTFAAENGCHSI